MSINDALSQSSRFQSDIDRLRGIITTLIDKKPDNAYLVAYLVLASGDKYKVRSFTEQEGVTIAVCNDSNGNDMHITFKLQQHNLIFLYKIPGPGTPIKQFPSIGFQKNL